MRSAFRLEIREVLTYVSKWFLDPAISRRKIMVVANLDSLAAAPAPELSAPVEPPANGSSANALSANGLSGSATALPNRDAPPPDELGYAPVLAQPAIAPVESQALAQPVIAPVESQGPTQLVVAPGEPQPLTQPAAEPVIARGELQGLPQPVVAPREPSELQALPPPVATLGTPEEPGRKLAEDAIAPVKAAADALPGGINDASDQSGAGQARNS